MTLKLVLNDNYVIYLILTVFVQVKEYTEDYKDKLDTVDPA